jgi:NAD(P) transhydrogenase subunit beta
LAILPPEQVADLSIAADAAHAVNPWVALAYLVAGVCFVLALRGLSSPATSSVAIASACSA